MSKHTIIISVASTMLPECTEIYAHFGMQDGVDVRQIAKRFAGACFGQGPFIFSTFPPMVTRTEIERRMRCLWNRYTA